MSIRRFVVNVDYYDRNELVSNLSKAYKIFSKGCVYP